MPNDIDALGRRLPITKLVVPGPGSSGPGRFCQPPASPDDDELSLAEVVDAGILTLAPVILNRFQLLLAISSGGDWIGLRFKCSCFRFFSRNMPAGISRSSQS